MRDQHRAQPGVGALPPYEIVRSARKSVALQIAKGGGLLVRAPKRMPLAAIAAFVGAHAAWAARKQAAYVRYMAVHPEPDAREIARLTALAKAHIPQRVAHWAQAMGLAPTGVRITAARTRFGSCSGKNSLCFSCFLMGYPQEAIEYVIVHELAHITHKNHGKEFYALLARYLPDYRQSQKLLRK